MDQIRRCRRQQQSLAAPVSPLPPALPLRVAHRQPTGSPQVEGVDVATLKPPTPTIITAITQATTTNR